MVSDGSQVVLILLSLMGLERALVFNWLSLVECRILLFLDSKRKVTHACGHLWCISVHRSRPKYEFINGQRFSIDNIFFLSWTKVDWNGYIGDVTPIPWRHNMFLHRAFQYLFLQIWISIRIFVIYRFLQKIYIGENDYLLRGKCVSLFLPNWRL